MAYESTGRVQQKLRTRDALVAAARAQVEKGLTPTVEEAAATAGVSRTTAYRYFTTQRALLSAAHPLTARTTLLPENPPEDPRERLDLVLSELISSNLAMEPQQRTMLRLSLEATPEERAGLLLRQGRAIPWIEEALSPLRGQLTDKQLHRLVLAIRATTGIESLVWLVDVAGLTREEAAELMRSSGQALLEHTLSNVAKPRKRR